MMNSNLQDTNKSQNYNQKKNYKIIKNQRQVLEIEIISMYLNISTIRSNLTIALRTTITEFFTKHLKQGKNSW